MQLINEEGAFYSLLEMQSKYKIKTNFLVYASLKSSIKSAINKMQVNPENNNIKPNIRTHLRPFFISKKEQKQSLTFFLQKIQFHLVN